MYRWMDLEEKRRLFVSDEPQECLDYQNKGYAVLGVLSKKDDTEKWSGIRYFIPTWEDYDEEWGLRVWQRMHGEPWQIAQTKRLVLREMIPEDTQELYQLYADPSITEYMEDLLEDPEAEKEYIRSYRENVYEVYGFGIWTVIRKEDGVMIGRAGLTSYEGREGLELGFVIGKKYQRQGYGQEACEAVIKYAQEALEERCIYARIHPKNTASIHLCRRLGISLILDDTL